MTIYDDEELERAFEQVQGHVLHLHAYWRIYRKLYRGNEYSAPILGTVASQFFGVLGKALPRLVFLILRQLTDPPKSLGKHNASLYGLLQAVAGADFRTTEPELVLLLESIEVNHAIRDLVNRAIAHISFDLVSGKTDTPTDVEIREIEQALKRIAEFTNRLGAKFLKVDGIDFVASVAFFDAQLDDLVETVRIGLETQGRELQDA